MAQTTKACLSTTRISSFTTITHAITTLKSEVMQHVHKRIRLDIQGGESSRQTQLEIPPTSPSASITPEDSSAAGRTAVGSNHIQQGQSRDSFAAILPTSHHQPPSAQPHEQIRLTTEQRECLQSFCYPRDGNLTMYDWYKDRVESPVEGTCNWFLEHASFNSWRLRESGPLMFSADSGCGKSVLAKYLIDHELPKLSATVCYFFFNDQDQNTVRQALCALLHQLFSQKRALIQHAMKLYNKLEGSLVQCEPSLWRILRDAVRDSRAGPIIFVIDALDECDESQLKRLITNLRSIIGKPHFQQSKLKVIMTSRPNEQVLGLFDSLQAVFPRTHIRGEEESCTIDQEINSVIHRRIEQLADKHQLSDKTKSSLASKLLYRSSYLWVRLVFEHLEEGFTKTAVGIDAAIQTLPETVNQAYDLILNRSRDDEIVKTVKVALSIILAVRRPLKISEMKEAMYTNGQGIIGRSRFDSNLERDVDFKSRLLPLCGLFVSVHDDKFFFFHQTAREFFLQSSAPTTVSSDDDSITTRDAHSFLTESCTFYLDMLDSTNPGVILEWTEHCRDAEFENGSAMADLAESSPNILIPSHVGHTLLSRGADLEAKDNRGRTALVIAAESGNEAATRSLLKDGADVEARDDDGWTALICAAIYSREAVARLLLENGANIDATDDYGWTALMHAARSGIKSVTRLLLVSDADLEARDDDGMTALIYAAKFGHEAVTQLLLENDSNIEAMDDNGWTALMHAVRSGHEAVTQLLLSNGADAQTRDYDGSTVLMYAAEFGLEAVMRLLLDKGVDIDECDGYGCTALMYAAIHDQEAVTRLLIEYGADFEVAAYDCRTALIFAVTFGNEAVTRLLLENGADVDAEGEEGMTALMTAADHGHEAVARLLLESGADIEAGAGEYRTALIYAVESGHEAIIQLLLDNGANIEATGEDRMTPLMFAVKYDHESIVRLLLKNGADVEAKDASGWTPLFHAHEYGRKALVKLLRYV